MKKVYVRTLTAVGIATCGLMSCSDNAPRDLQEEAEPEAKFGIAEVALTNAPDDVQCVRITVEGESETVERSFDLESEEKAVFQLNGLPTGRVQFSADAFDAPCDSATSAEQSWTSQPVTTVLIAGVVKNVALLMVKVGDVAPAGGLAHASLDFTGACSGGGTPSSNPQPYAVPVAPGVETYAILTVGDSPNLKPDGVTPYRLVGIPDGTGAYDNGDGCTFTWLVNHELGANQGIARAHGAPGSFVSKHIVDKKTLQVIHSSDLIQQHVLWQPGVGYAAPSTGEAFGRFCSATLAEESAFYDVESETGFQGRFFMNGEETGLNGRGFAHGLDGISYEVPRLGKMAWENSVANPKPGLTTVVAGMDDSGNGKVYFYYGTKTNTGSPVERAGLTNGNLYGLRINATPLEPALGIAVPTSFDLYNFGNVEDWTGDDLNGEAIANGVTGWQRPEDGAWDPNNPNHYYWVTTAAVSGTPPVSATRLWVLRFNDVHNPALGGQIEMLIDGLTDGGIMFDNMTLDRYGHVYLQEDPGGHVHNAKIWRYDIATDSMTVVAQHHPPYFVSGVDPLSFLTENEETSGIIDASDILGPGWLLSVVQAHHPLDAELVEGGQLFALYDPAAAGLTP